MIFVYLLIGIVVVPIALLAIPVHIEYSYNSQAERPSRWRVIWLFGLVRFSPIPPSKTGKSAANTDDQRIKTKLKVRKPGKQKKQLRVLLAVMTSEGFLRRILRLLYKILTAVKIRQLQARLYFGLDDPADTGRLFGLMVPVISNIYAIPRLDFVATPLFDRVGVEANIYTSIVVVPINYIRPVVTFIFSKETLRAIRAAIRVYRS